MPNFVIIIWRVSMRSRSSHHLLPDKMAPNCPVLLTFRLPIFEPSALRPIPGQVLLL
jgi:hypothetical protein